MAALIGMKAITDYVMRHESTVLSMVRQYPTFPIKKIGGIWESDTESIDSWKKRYFEGQEPVNFVVDEPAKPEKPKAKGWKSKRK